MATDLLPCRETRSVRNHMMGRLVGCQKEYGGIGIRKYLETRR